MYGYQCRFQPFVNQLTKELDYLKSEYELKLQQLEQFKSELALSQSQAQYLESAEQQTQLRLSKFLNSTSGANTSLSTSVLSGAGQSAYVQKHHKSMVNLNVMTSNPMKAFSPFMTLRVSLNSNGIEELSHKMEDLLSKLERIYQLQEEEDLQTEILVSMRSELLLQKECDHFTLVQILPDVRDMSNTLQMFLHTKFVNQTRVNTAMSGINKCKGEMNEFNVNKAERVLAKRKELIEEEQETVTLKKTMEGKEKLLEDLKKKLAILRRENESIKIEEIMVKFFEKRNVEEDVLNKLEMLNFLENYMARRKETNCFSQEEDLKSVKEYKFLFLAMTKSVAFKNKIWPPPATRVGFLGTKKRSTNSSIDVTPRQTPKAAIKESTPMNPLLRNIQMKERQGQEQTKHVKLRWGLIKELVDFGSSEEAIVRQFEKVMILNQLLNVCFDDLTTEKNKRKLLLEELQRDLQWFKQEWLSSQKFLNEDDNYTPESYTNLLFLFDGYEKTTELKAKVVNRKQFRKKIFQFLNDLMIKASYKLDKLKQVAPQVEFYKLAQIVQKFMDEVLSKQSEQKTDEEEEMLKLMRARPKTKKLQSSALLVMNLTALKKRQTSDSPRQLTNRQSEENQHLQPPEDKGKSPNLQQQVSFFRNPSSSVKAKKQEKRKKKYSKGGEDLQGNMLFSKVQQALKDYLNIMLFIDYIKVVSSGLREMIRDEQAQYEALQRPLDFIPITQNLHFNNRGLKPQQFNSEYQKCQKIFHIKPRNPIVREYHDLLQAKEEKPLFLLESRLKQRVIEKDDEEFEQGLTAKQYRQIKEDRLQAVRDKELAAEKLEAEKKKLAMISPSAMRLFNLNHRPTASSTSALSGSTQARSYKTSPRQKGETFKDIYQILQDFQKGEMRFLNKFVKECDDVSLKINRFAAAVMPPSEKVLMNKEHGRNTTTSGSEDYPSAQVSHRLFSNINSLEKGGVTFSKQSEQVLGQRVTLQKKAQSSLSAHSSSDLQKDGAAASSTSGRHSYSSNQHRHLLIQNQQEGASPISKFSPKNAGVQRNAQTDIKVGSLKKTQVSGQHLDQLNDSDGGFSERSSTIDIELENNTKTVQARKSTQLFTLEEEIKLDEKQKPLHKISTFRITSQIERTRPNVQSRMAGTTEASKARSNSKNKEQDPIQNAISMIESQGKGSNAKVSIFAQNKKASHLSPKQNLGSRIQMGKSSSLVHFHQIKPEGSVQQEQTDGQFFASRQSNHQRKVQQFEELKQNSKSVVLLQDLIKASTSNQKLRSERALEGGASYIKDLKQKTIENYRESGKYLESLLSFQQNQREEQAIYKKNRIISHQTNKGRAPKQNNQNGQGQMSGQEVNREMENQTVQLSDLGYQFYNPVERLLGSSDERMMRQGPVLAFSSPESQSIYNSPDFYQRPLSSQSNAYVQRAPLYSQDERTSTRGSLRFSYSQSLLNSQQLSPQAQFSSFLPNSNQPHMLYSSQNIPIQNHMAQNDYPPQNYQSQQRSIKSHKRIKQQAASNKFMAYRVGANFRIDELLGGKGSATKKEKQSDEKEGR